MPLFLNAKSYLRIQRFRVRKHHRFYFFGRTPKGIETVKRSGINDREGKNVPGGVLSGRVSNGKLH
jgi:hypothetical protein